MRRSPGWGVAVGVLVWSACWPAVGRAGVWATLAAGLAGNSAPTSQTEFWFDTPHGPAVVGVSELSGGTTAEATTGGGSVFFGGAGTPVLLNLGDGSGYVAGGSPPDAAKTFSPSAGGGASPSTAAPAAGGSLPSDAALLGVNLAEPDAAGARALTVTATDPNGNPQGSGTVTIPDGGWWVIGLTPTDPDVDHEGPPPVDGGTDGGSGGGGNGEQPPPPPPTSGGGSVTTPEPSTVALAGLGGLGVAAWRRLGRRRRAE